MRHVGLFVMVLSAGCAPDADLDAEEPRFVDPEEEGEGVAFDERHPGVDVGPGKADLPRTYAVPETLPWLERPEIIISLEGLTVHLFDRSTGWSSVYPTGVGKRGESGRSYTPTGFFRTADDGNTPWYHIWRRYQPEYFGGFPFLRLTIENSKGYHTYGLHGPITYRCPEGFEECDLLQREWFLVRDFVSQGCMRMEPEGIVELFHAVRAFDRVPVAIMDEVEHDANGAPIDVGAESVLWREGEAIDYGACGRRPDPYLRDDRWPSPHCDAQ
ncbi:MAG: L,D-transpeptidase [Myxococcota bacterium]